MRHRPRSAFLAACLLGSVALPAQAADRTRAGQWESTVTVKGRTMTASNCLLQSEADAMNGDTAAIRTFLDKRAAAKAFCKVTDVKASGNRLVVTEVCNGAPMISTTDYHGDSFDTVNSNGLSAKAKWTGPCR